MVWPIVVGATLAAAGLYGASKQKTPAQINIQYPDPDPVEQEMARLQLDIARKLKTQIDDPTILQDIYKLLPETKMSAQDRAKFTEEYSQITELVYKSAMDQASQGVGRDLQDLVDRGIMSQEQADRQGAQNKAAINSVMSVLSKKMESSRIRMARGDWLTQSKLGLESGSAIARVDEMNKRMMNKAVTSGLDYFNQRAQNVTGLQRELLNANLQTSLSTAETKQQVGLGSLLQMASIPGDVYAEKQKMSQWTELLKGSQGQADRLAGFEG